MKLEEAKALYSEEWIAFHAFEESDNPEGEVVLHNKDRRAFDMDILERGLTDVYITFADPLIEENRNKKGEHTCNHSMNFSISNHFTLCSWLHLLFG